MEFRVSHVAVRISKQGTVAHVLLGVCYKDR